MTIKEKIKNQSYPLFVRFLLQILSILPLGVFIMYCSVFNLKSNFYAIGVGTALLFLCVVAKSFLDKLWEKFTFHEGKYDLVSMKAFSFVFFFFLLRDYNERLTKLGEQPSLFIVGISFISAYLFGKIMLKHLREITNLEKSK